MIVLSSGNHSLIKVSGSLPFSWFVYDQTIPNEKRGVCVWRDRGYIYISGHKTQQEAMDHAERENIITVDPQGEL